MLLKLLPRCERLRFAFEFALIKIYLLVYLYLVLFKGGIPAAPSGTATLLRLSPSHRFYPRQLPYGSPSSGTPDSHGLTGGVYKVRERIHRAMADARLLAIPTSWSRVADSNPNWDILSEIRLHSHARCPLWMPL